LKVAFAADPPVVWAGGVGRREAIRSISRSSTSTMPPLSPETFDRKLSGTWETRSMIGEPTPTRSSCGCGVLIAFEEATVRLVARSVSSSISIRIE
jgi:hypothetical protein